MRGVLIVLYVLAVLVVLFVAAAVATREDDVLADAPPDVADLGLPDGPMYPEDVAEVRFGLTLRGYRMSEVDEVLERLAGELAGRDARIVELEQALVDLVEPEVEQAEARLGLASPSSARAAEAVSFEDDPEVLPGVAHDPQAWGAQEEQASQGGWSTARDELAAPGPVLPGEAHDPAIEAAQDPEWMEADGEGFPSALDEPGQDEPVQDASAPDENFPELYPPDPARDDVNESAFLLEPWPLGQGAPDAPQGPPTTPPTTPPITPPTTPPPVDPSPLAEDDGLPEAPLGAPGEGRASSTDEDRPDGEHRPQG